MLDFFSCLSAPGTLAPPPAGWASEPGWLPADGLIALACFALAFLLFLFARRRSMALVPEHLYHSSSLSNDYFVGHLKNLVNHLFAAYSVDHGRVRQAW